MNHIAKAIVEQLIESEPGRGHDGDVGEELARRMTAKGYKASWEYPGYVYVVLDSGRDFCAGTANGGWGYDTGLADGSMRTGSDGDEDLPLTTPVDELEAWLEAALKKESRPSGDRRKFDCLSKTDTTRVSP